MRKLQKQQDKRNTQKQILSRMTALLVGLVCCLTMVLGQGQVVKGASPVIDTTKKGSITIHKYEYNNTDGEKGNGEAGQTVPVGATALDDVGFTLYVLNDYDTADEIKAYYSSSNTTTLEPTSYYTYNSTTDTYTAKTGAGTGKVTQKKTGTTASGVLTFSDLPVGIYLVVETSSPAKVTKKAEPFLVSVPMTNSIQAGWNYDIHVYPKNKTTKGGIKLKKTDASGNPLTKSVSFVLQSDLDNDGVYETVTQNADGDAIGIEDATFSKIFNTTDGILEITNLAPGKYRFIEVSVGDNFGYILDGEKKYPFEINSDGTTNLALSPNDGTYITVKNEKPDVEKKVLKKGGDVGTPGDWVDDANYSIGDTVTYQVMVDVPSNVASLKEFKIKDTPSGIKYDSMVRVEYSTDGGTSYSPLTEITHYKATVNGDGFELELTSDGRTAVSNSTGSKIRIRYKAIVQNAAVSTEAGNVNRVDLIYEDKILPENQDDGNPNPTTKPSDPNSEYKIEDETVVHCFQLDIKKTGADGTTKLQDVEFDLYVRDDSSGTVAGDDAKALGLDNTPGVKWRKVNPTVIATNSSGQASIAGLSAGTYYLVETKTATGYNLLSKPVKLEIESTSSTSWAPNTPAPLIYDKNGTATTTITHSMKVDGGAAQDNLTVNIKNSKGFTLPQTGGAGGFLLTVIGCGVMILGIVLFHKSRDNKKEEAA